MPSRPARFEFGSIPQPEAVEAAARRRMRAFNALEDQLACDQASARKRASAWLERVRQRVAGSTARR